jgi:hypothetical protein
MFVPALMVWLPLIHEKSFRMLCVPTSRPFDEVVGVEVEEEAEREKLPFNCPIVSLSMSV